MPILTDELKPADAGVEGKVGDDKMVLVARVGDGEVVSVEETPGI